MENASKALVMAGGILIAILVIGALLLMINQIGDYERSQDTDKRTSQLVEFNMDFERYCDNKGIKGLDIISLINKVIDYNNKAINKPVNAAINYDIKMSITVSGLNEFNKKYSYDKENPTNMLFAKDSYIFRENNLNNTLKNDLDNFIKLESIENNRDKLKILSATYNPNKNATENEKIIKEKSEELGIDWNINDIPLDTIKKYRQYSEFKSSTFKVDQTQENQGIVYENGQIQKFYFKFVK